MLFNSYIFIFAFLPIVWGLYALTRACLPAQANALLVLASLFFYGWWDIRFLGLLLGSIAVNFWLGRKIAVHVAQGRPAAARGWMVFGVVANLATLGVFKYVDFFLESLSTLTQTPIPLLGVVLPIGISFFTFQQIGYLADVKNGRSDRYGLVDYALFVSFFPQLIAGPIVHHREMMPQFVQNRSIQAQDVAIGLTIFIAGLFKKVVIADGVAPFSSAVFNAADAGMPVSSFEAWGAALAYTSQIYFDFSGYSDMALGLGRMFGIRLPINFNSPYKATSIIDFWRRWHITLSRFLRDYLYIPLGGNKRGAGRRHINLFLTMLLGGIWHGAGWGFVIWGALHGLYLIFNHAVRALRLPPSRVLSVGGWAVTFVAVVFAWVFFRATTFDGAAGMASAMIGIGGFSVPVNFADNLGNIPQKLGLVYGPQSVLTLREWVLTGIPLVSATLLLAVLAPNTNQMILSNDSLYTQGYDIAPPRALVWRPRSGYAFVLIALGGVALINISTLSEFLYFQF